MEREKPALPTRPPPPTDDLLRQKFDEDIVNQAQRLDDIAKLLISVELAVPGLYATALKLVSGGNAALAVGPAVYGALFFWFVAPLLTLLALLPRRYEVDRNITRRTPPNEFAEPLSIEAYFKKTTRYKYQHIVLSCICFFIGTSAAVCSIL